MSTPCRLFLSFFLFPPPHTLERPVIPADTRMAMAPIIRRRQIANQIPHWCETEITRGTSSIYVTAWLEEGGKKVTSHIWQVTTGNYRWNFADVRRPQLLITFQMMTHTHTHADMHTSERWRNEKKKTSDYNMYGIFIVTHCKFISILKLWFLATKICYFIKVNEMKEKQIIRLISLYNIYTS